MSQTSEADLVFLSLIFNIQQAALQQMGKVVSPLSGKIERSLGGARQSIDLLESLERKTRGNLHKDEERALEEILTNLRLNYVDEVKKDQAGQATDAGATETAEGEEETPADASGEPSPEEKDRDGAGA